MPKLTKHPRLRSHVRKNASGKVRVYYYYDGRPDGKPDTPLGTEYEEAVALWEELHLKRPCAVGRLQEAVTRWRNDELPKYANAETRRGYSKQLDRLEAVLGGMTWDELDLPILREYLDRRTAKTQGNREMSLLSVIWGKARLWGMTRLPWPAAGVKNWKNEERARQFEVTDQLFSAVYAEADQMLKDCMDIATATGMRLTDVRTVLLPAGDVLRLRASKTGKAADFDLSMSQVMPDLLKRRRAIDACHLMLLSTPDGFPVSARMLRTAWDNARERAASRPENAAIAASLRAMFLRDMRKRASDLAADSEQASKLLQHSSVALTERHYRATVTRLKTVR